MIFWFVVALEAACATLLVALLVSAVLYNPLTGVVVGVLVVGVIWLTVQIMKEARRP